LNPALKCRAIVIPSLRDFAAFAPFARQKIQTPFASFVQPKLLLAAAGFQRRQERHICSLQSQFESALRPQTGSVCGKNPKPK
jgi:hypothetical protein